MFFHCRRLQPEDIVIEIRSDPDDRQGSQEVLNKIQGMKEAVVVLDRLTHSEDRVTGSMR